MSRRTVYRLGLLALALGLAGMTDMVLFNEGIFGPRYGGETAARASYLMSMWLGVAGMAVASFLAIKLGAARTALVGLVLGALGVVLAMLGARYLGSLVTPFGLGIFRPCPLGAAAAIVAAQRLGRLRFLAMTAATIACSAATDSAWILGHDVFELLDLEGSGIGITVVAILAISALCTLWSEGMDRRPAKAAPVIEAPYRAASPVLEEPPPDCVPPVARPLRGVLVLLLPVMILVTFSYRIEIVYQVRLASVASSVLSVVRFLVGMGATMYFVKAVRRAESSPPLRVWAYALIVYGLDLFLARWVVEGSDGLAGMAAGLLAAVSSPFLWAIGNSYAALAVPPRYATAALAAWMTGVSLVVWPLNAVVSIFGTSPLLPASIVIFCVGFYLRRHCGRLHVSLFDPPLPAASTTTSAVGTRP